MHSFMVLSVSFSLTVTVKAFFPGYAAVIFTAACPSAVFRVAVACVPPLPTRQAIIVCAPPLIASWIASVVPPLPKVFANPSSGFNSTAVFNGPKSERKRTAVTPLTVPLCCPVPFF